MFRLISKSVAGRVSIEDKSHGSFTDAEKAARELLESPRIAEVTILATVQRLTATHDVRVAEDNTGTFKVLKDIAGAARK